MATIYELQQRADALRKKTATDSISPEEVGGLHADTLAYIANMERYASSLGIKKVYTSVSEMNGDESPVSSTGMPLKAGQLVTIFNAEAPDAENSGEIYAFQNPGWVLIGRLDAGTADTLKKLIEGDKATVSNNNRNAFVWLGNFETWAEAQGEIDKLHAIGEDNTKVGEFRLLLNGRNLIVYNYVQNWATGVFTQTVKGSIQWNTESQTMDQSLNINTYERSYNEGTGWTTWEEGTAKIELAQELSTEEGSENKAISQKTVSEAINNIYIPLEWKGDVRQTRIQVPATSRTKNVKLFYKKQLPTIVNMLISGYPQSNKGGSFNVEIDGNIIKVQTESTDNTSTKIAEAIVKNVTSDNWNITNTGSTVIFTAKNVGQTSVLPFAYNNLDGCWLDFKTEIKQFGINEYICEEFIGTSFDDNTFGNVDSNWVDLSEKTESSVYETVYKYNPLLTRMYVPINYRKNGQTIKYTDNNGKKVEETYIGEKTDNTDWCNSINWRRSNGKVGYLGSCEHLFTFNETDWWETTDYESYSPIELSTNVGTLLASNYVEVDKLGSRVLLFTSNPQLKLLLFDENKEVIPTKMNIQGNNFVNYFSCYFLPLNAKYVRVIRNIGYFEETEQNMQYKLKTLHEGDDVVTGQYDIDINKLGYCRERKMLQSGIPNQTLNEGIVTVSTNLFPINTNLKYLIFGILPNKSNDTPIFCFYDKDFVCVETVTVPYTTVNTTTKSMFGYVTPPENARYCVASWHDVYGGVGSTILRVVGEKETLNNYVLALYSSKIKISETLDYKSLGDSISAERGSYPSTVAEKLHSRAVEHCAVGGAGFTLPKNGIYWIGKQLDKIPEGYEGIITLMGGINDWARKSPLGTAQEAIGKSMDDCYGSNTLMDNFRWVLETLVKKCSWKARIFILTQLERYPYVEDAGYTIEEMRVETEKLAAHYLLPIIDVGRKCGLRNGDNLEEDWRRVDGGTVKVHPTLDGHNVIGSYVAGQILSMLNGGIKVYPKIEE